MLNAISSPTKGDAECADRLADGIAALVRWWKLHHFAMDKDAAQGFNWWWADGGQVQQLRQWAVANARDKNAVADAAAKRLARDGVLGATEALKVVQALWQ